MDDWQILLGDLRIAPFSDGEVFVAALGKAGVAAPVVGNGALHEAAERLRAAVRHDGEPNRSAQPPPFRLSSLVPGLRWRTSTALATRTLSWTPRPLPRDRCQPRFHRLRRARRACRRSGPDPGAPSPRGACGGFGTPSRSATGQVVAKLHGRHAGRLAGHQIGRPKPYAQRRVRARHDRSHRQSGVTAALAAGKTPGRFAKRNGSPAA